MSEFNAFIGLSNSKEVAKRDNLKDCNLRHLKKLEKQKQERIRKKKLVFFRTVSATLFIVIALVIYKNIF